MKKGIAPPNIISIKRGPRIEDIPPIKAGIIK